MAARLDKMVTAYGHTVVNEYPAETYIREKLHRTASGSVLQKSRIPAFTAELGTVLVPDPAIIQAACAGTRNVMRWAGMLKDDTEAIEGIRVIRPGYAVRRMRTPRVPEACIVHHLVDAGMRQLWHTGWMHNRVRMVTASFLVKNLLQDWRHGAEFFWNSLLDADLANNSAGWQWIAGCGADAAPYFRVFNPVSQGAWIALSGRFSSSGTHLRM